MTDPVPLPTVPPPTPGDALVGKIINYVTLIAVLALLILGGLLAFERTVPQILETVVTIALTALVSLLTGRTQR